ncbi:zinc metallopeptidase [Enterococcus gallinarum]|uniref:zinc metallopeptidase n=1 Tax=Enterococcus gallinarum TaxID=1353 RepID=UPI000F4D34CD|nr:zinc metallopeptidase [Enterococcus gallinarum]ROZ05534.1 zinc metallopeptidase [Enterococcus gallinarum]ROZ11845.1 zinc metallopeptidase [Enterococcus gallinarum]
MYGIGGYGFGWFYDPTFILVIIGMVISMAASAYVKITFSKYDKISSRNNITGTKAAQYILESQGINNVGVQAIAGDLTDNYNSGNKMLSLSQATAQSTSVAAIGVAAHECGHAVQDAKGYLPLRIRHAIVPVANIGSAVSIPLILIGVLLRGSFLINLGILAFSLAFIFQLVTLPVEFDASRRALRILADGGLLTEEEVPQARKVLFAAALTYVAAAVATLLQLLRLIILFGNNNRRD